MLTVEQRVQRGVAFLDLFASDGWREEIGMDDICMSSSEMCIIGQVFGNYLDFIRDHDFMDSMMADYGFNKSHRFDEDEPEDWCCFDCDGNSGVDNYTALEDEWKRVLS